MFSEVEKIRLAQKTRKEFQNLSKLVKLAIDTPEKAPDSYQNFSNVAITLVTNLKREKAASSGELKKTAAKVHSLFVPPLPQKDALSINQLLEILKEFFLKKPKKDNAMREESQKKP